VALARLWAMNAEVSGAEPIGGGGAASLAAACAKAAVSASVHVPGAVRLTRRAPVRRVVTTAALKD